MTARAHYLARTLVARLRGLEEALLDEPHRSEQSDAARRQEIVGKVLVMEEGITDFATTQLVATALPRVAAQEEPRDRDVRELADFLDAHLDLSSPSRA